MHTKEGFSKYRAISWVAQKYEADYEGITIAISSIQYIMLIIEAIEKKLGIQGITLLKGELIDALRNMLWNVEDKIKEIADNELSIWYNEINIYTDKLESF